MTYKTILLAIIFNIFLLNCKKDPREIAKDELTKQMEPSRLKLESFKKQPLYWNSEESDKNKCIMHFLQSIENHNNVSTNDCLIEQREWVESFLPYVYGKGTLLDSTPLEKYLQITDERKKIGLEKISTLVRDKKYKITDIKWIKNEKSDFQHFVGWKPVIYLSINRNTFVINEIKQVIEYKGTYRIAVIAP